MLVHIESIIKRAYMKTSNGEDFFEMPHVGHHLQVFTMNGATRNVQEMFFQIITLLNKANIVCLNCHIFVCFLQRSYRKLYCEQKPYGELHLFLVSIFHIVSSSICAVYGSNFDTSYDHIILMKIIRQSLHSG